jgi:DTW domain-containing protein YfiP
MARRVCVCDLIPALKTGTPVLLMTHRYERRRSSNTGRLLELALSQATVRVYGLAPGDDALEGSEAPPVWLLHPGADAEVLGPADAGARPTLVVPDGSWRQTRRWLRRHGGAPGLRRVTLPEGPPTAYQLRSDGRPGYLSTFEAVVRALALLGEDPAVEEELMRLFRVVVDRTLWTRGLLPAEEVSGGVPPRRPPRSAPAEPH